MTDETGVTSAACYRLSMDTNTRNPQDPLSAFARMTHLGFRSFRPSRPFRTKIINAVSIQTLDVARPSSDDKRMADDDLESGLPAGYPTYRDKRTERFANGERVKEFHAFEQQAKKRLRMLLDSVSLNVAKQLI